MKNILLSVILVILAGCDYEIPLRQTASSVANPALAGTWAGQPADEETVSMKIATSGTDYFVTYTQGSNSLSFNGFEIKAADLNLIQLELRGDTEGSKAKYVFAKYELTPAGLSVHRLNPNVVSAKCQTAEELLNDINVHRQNPFLFSEPLKFTKSTPQ